MKYIIFVFAVCLLENFGSAESNKCPKFQSVRDFDFEKYAGIWYQAEIFPRKNESLFKCTKLTYKFLPNNTYAAETRFQERTGKEDKLNFVIRPKGDIKMGELIIEHEEDATFFTLNYFPEIIGITEIPLTVLATDYENYTLTWSCIEEPYYYMALINLRHRPASVDVMNRVYKFMENYKIDKSFPQKVLFDDCSN